MSEQIDALAEWNSVAQERQDPTAPPVQNAPPEEPKAETAPAQETQVQEAVDPYAGLHPDVRAKLERFDQMAASQASLMNDLKAATGRIGALQSEFSKLRQPAAGQPTQTQVTAAAKDPEKWAALKSDFPEWGTAITDYVESRIGTLGTPGLTQEQVEQIVAAKSEGTTGEIAGLAKQLREAIVTVAHSNWKADVNTPEFAAWFRGQPQQVQALASSDDPGDAIDMLNRYARDKAKPVAAVKEDRKQRLAAAVTSKPGGSAVVAKKFEDMTPQEQWNYMATQREKAAA